MAGVRQPCGLSNSDWFIRFKMRQEQSKAEYKNSAGRIGPADLNRHSHQGGRPYW